MMSRELESQGLARLTDVYRAVSVSVHFGIKTMQSIQSPKTNFEILPKLYRVTIVRNSIDHTDTYGF